MNEVIEVLSTGVGLSIQDSGRSGWLRYGVPVGGAMDRHAMKLANRLLGNRDDAPVLELVHSGVKLRVLADTWLAFAGADLGYSVEPWQAKRFAPGTVLNFPRPVSGLFAYVAVLGGVVSDTWFGSASADLRNGLGQRLESGSLVSAWSAEPNFSIERIGARIALPEDRRDFPKSLELDVLKGPQFELFDDASRRALVSSKWTVSPRSDRTGFRLQGPKLRVPNSINSEPVLPGSFQIPGSGQPIVTMVDGPTVGGYAKLAVLPDCERDRLAQCAPSTQVSFKWID